MRINNVVITNLPFKHNNLFYFAGRFIEMGNEKVKVYREVQKIAINKIKELCKLVNQMMLLQNLNETRMCDQLLEPETGEDLQHVAVEHNSISHKFGHQLKYSDGRFPLTYNFLSF